MTTPMIGHFIGGNPMASRSERTSDVFNPATGAVSAKVALATAAELNAAVAAAHAAFPAWSQTSPLRRARVMFKFKELLEQNADKLAALITSEHGKVFTDAKGEVTRGIEVVEFACGIPQLMKGEYSEQVAGGIDAWSIRQAL
ncbi:aldehyde dehydrogenase family protein, partial [Janthinobacterium rivuli]|uniref:aldehyde dehydrogenase family protein n=1 Tax=Janthinobacterium sp. FT68W TaxID=2654255 RepID=UPI001264693B